MMKLPFAREEAPTRNPRTLDPLERVQSLQQPPSVRRLRILLHQLAQHCEAAAGPLLQPPAQQAALFRPQPLPRRQLRLQRLQRRVARPQQQAQALRQRDGPARGGAGGGESLLAAGERLRALRRGGGGGEGRRGLRPRPAEGWLAPPRLGGRACRVKSRQRTTIASQSLRPSSKRAWDIFVRKTRRKESMDVMRSSAGNPSRSGGAPSGTSTDA